MKKRLLRGVAIAAMTGLVLTARAQDSTSQYPTILQQPDDQCVPIGSVASYSVLATNAVAYQWYKNNVQMDGETNSSITISNAGINDVGYYSAAVMNSLGVVPTRSANMNVYTTSSTTGATTSSFPKTKLLSTQSMSMMSQTDMGGGGPITVYGLPVTGNGGTGSCPGRYSSYVSYTKPATNGWGWGPTAGMTHIASDENRSDTKVTFMGQYGDTGCGASSVTVSNPISPYYRFCIFFPTNVTIATNTAYPITLSGFDP